MKRFLMVCVMVLCVALIVIANTSNAYAASGTYDGISWDLTGGVLTLGREGETQTLTNRDTRYASSWPWYGDRERITSVVTNGDLVLQGSLRCMFYYCSSLTSLDVSGFDTSNVTDMYEMFYYCGRLTSLDFSGWNVPNVTDMGYMFYHCTGLTSLDLSGWNAQSVANVNCMFQYCEGLTSLDLSGWNAQSVANMGSMFGRCISLTSLDLSGFNTSNVTTMNGIFYQCISLTSLDISGWNTSSVAGMNNMFERCNSLYSVKLGENNPFNGSGTSVTLPTPPASKDGIRYTQKWIHEDGTFGPFTSEELRDNYTSEMQGTWIWEAVPTEYTLVFTASDYSEVTGFMENETPVAKEEFTLPANQFVLFGYTFDHWDDGNGHTYIDGAVIPANTYAVGSIVTLSAVMSRLPEYTIAFNASSCPTASGAMPNVTVLTTEAYQIPANQFVLFGFSFDHWDDGNGHTYADQGTIPANTYTAGANVALSAVMEPRDTSVQMQDGEFTFSIKGDEKAFFDEIPAGTSYSVFEENIPADWVLIAQSNSTGLIYPLETSEALFLNKYQPDLATIQFTGRKLMDGQPAKADSFSFELWEGNILLQTKSVIDGGFVQFDILEYDRNDVGIHTYTIKELIGDDQTLLYDGHEETIAVEVTTEEGEDNITRVYAEVTYSDGTYPDVLFQNWTKPGELSLKKLVDDLLEGHEGDEFRFRITLKQENGLPLTDELTYSIEP